MTKFAFHFHRNWQLHHLVLMSVILLVSNGAWAGWSTDQPVHARLPVFSLKSIPITQSDNGGGMTLEQATARARKHGRIVRAKTIEKNGVVEHHIRVLDKKGRVKNLRYKAKSSGKTSKRRRPVFSRR
ncbi:MAG: hypothetical protein HKM24_08055 [Gammaproteobacteria bacterium]|nr:hypothetical protein [Gammaproteobacteria bacterium]